MLFRFNRSETTEVSLNFLLIFIKKNEIFLITTRLRFVFSINHFFFVVLNQFNLKFSGKKKFFFLIPPSY